MVADKTASRTGLALIFPLLPEQPPGLAPLQEQRVYTRGRSAARVCSRPADEEELLGRHARVRQLPGLHHVAGLEHLDGEPQLAELGGDVVAGPLVARE